MKAISTLLLIFFTCLLASGQTPWKPQGQGLLPAKYGISDIVAIDENVVWALATAGNINGVLDTSILLRTTNGGDTWEARPLHEFAGRNALFLSAVSADTAWLSMYAPPATEYIYKTVDGGTTWNQQSSMPANAAQVWAPAIKFVSGNEGFFVDLPTKISGNTTDGGMTWDTATTHIWLSNEWWGMTTSQNWLETYGDTLWWGTSKRIFKSSDKGQHWQEYYPAFPGNNMITSIAFNPQGVGLAISDGDLDLPFIPSFLSETVIAKSNDWGATWNVLAENVPFPLTAIADVPGLPNTFVAVSGVWGWLYPEIQLSWASAYTTDGGESWVAIDRDVPYHAIGFVSPTVGWTGRVGNHDYGPDNPAFFKWNGNLTSTKQFDNAATSGFSVFPNPFTDYFQVKNPSEIAIDYLELMNANGVSLRKMSVQEVGKQNFSDLPAGTYLLRIVVSGNSFFEKVVKM